MSPKGLMQVQQLSFICEDSVQLQNEWQQGQGYQVL